MLLGIVKFNEISKLEIASEIAAVSDLRWLSQFFTLKKIGIGCMNIQKFVNSTHTK